MGTPYDLITITPFDLNQFRCKAEKGKIQSLIDLVIEEAPKTIHTSAKFAEFKLEEIEGFEDNLIKGFEIKVDRYLELERFIKKYIPFLLMKKK